MKIAVIGHLEWSSFTKVDHAVKPGEIERTSDSWEEVGGGGAVAAIQLSKLNGSCTFFTAIGNDESGKKALDQLKTQGVEVHAYIDEQQPTRRIFVQIDKDGQRSGDLTGNIKPLAKESDHLPWNELSQYDAAYL